MDQYLIYLRKSRKDRELEQQTGTYDTLQRHRDTLTGLARQRGYHIAYIYEEVVSGDTIAERPEMQKLLAAVETGAFVGVLVMEIPRLARGNTRDQGTVSETFQCSGTKIITPDKIYDPSDESDEEYFEFGLFMSRREYKAINRRLQKGRMASLREGKYIAGTPPYGYQRLRAPHGRGYTLETVPEKAAIVREVFQLYIAGSPMETGTAGPMGSHRIADLLNRRGVLSPGGLKWTAAAVRDILKNPTYTGSIRWSYRADKKQMSDGVPVTSRPINKDAPLYKGIHPAIITEETWVAAQRIMAERRHPPIPGEKRISNPLAGLIYCSHCGHSLVQLPQGSHGAPLLLCPTAKCPTVSSRRDVVEQALLTSLRQWLNNYEPDLSQADLIRHSCEDGIRAAEIQLDQLRRHLDALNGQRETLYDLLEQQVYSREVFLERSHTLADRIADTEAQARKLEAHLEVLKKSAADQTALLPQIRHVLDIYDKLDSPAEKNALLKAVLDHVVYSKSVGGQWRESDLTLFLYPKLPYVR